MEKLRLEQFILEHGEDMLRFAYTYVKKRDVAEDIVQDVLLKAYEKQDQFLGQSSYKTYLYRMIINRSYDYFRSWHYRNTVLTDRISKIIKKPSVAPTFGDEDTYLGECILSLPVKYREVIVLYYYKDFTIDMVANLLSLPISTVKTRLVRGREKLKKMLKEEMDYGTFKSEGNY